MKIIEITAEKMTAQQLEEVKTSTLKEIHVLNMVKGHPTISTLHIYPCWPASLLLFSSLWIRSTNSMMFVLFLVTLIDSYESTTFIFLVFDL